MSVAEISKLTHLCRRGYFITVSIQDITPSLLKLVYNGSLTRGALMSLDSGFLFSYDIEPFLLDILTHCAPSAYPPTRSERYLPLNIYSWTLPTSDSTMYDMLIKSAGTITSAAIAEGQSITNAPLYPNYALYGTPLEKMYGNTVGPLAALKTKCDSDNVMGLTGEW